MRFGAGLRWTLGRLIGVAATAVIAVLSLLGVAGYVQVQALIEDQATVSRQHDVLAELVGLQGLVTDAETGQRGFIVTGDESYLGPYEVAAREVPGAVRRLRELTAASPGQQRTLDELEPAIRAKFAELAQTVTLRRTQGFEGARQVVVTGRGQAAMAEIQTQLHRMRQVEWAELVAGQEHSVAVATRTRAVVLWGYVGGVILVGVAAVIVWRAMAAPVDRVTSAARRVAGGDLSTRLAEENGLAEVAQMAAAVNASIDTAVRSRDAAVAASSAKSTFLATMSHEIRTPLNAVIGMADLLGETDLDPAQREFAHTIRSSGEALLTLINDVLDFSKIEAGDLDLESRPFLLRECLEEATAQLGYAASRKGLELVLDVHPDCPDVVVGDENRLRQILANLLNNAVKFTGGGEVVLTVDVPDGDPPVLRAAVRDTGIGIPADRLDRLFQPFRQVDSSTTRVYGGSGLGLAISRRLARAIGGDLTVASRLGAGSTFTLTTPLELPETPRATATPAPPELAGRTALLVDDNAASRRVLRTQLESLGLACTDVASAGDALDLLAGGAGFDVVLLDLLMPGTTGSELASAVREHADAVPIVLLSGAPGRTAAADDAVPATVLTKPVRAAALAEQLSALLRPATVTAAVGAVDAGGPAPEGPPPGAGDLRILLAEDNLVNQRVTALMLQNLGHHLDVVEDGRQAVDAVLDREYDLVLMDVQMPEMDGLTAARLICSHTPADRRPYLVAMTAGSFAEDVAASHAAGMDAHLSKPTRIHELQAVLTEVRRRQRAHH
jgi:signal transduction histidine kinase/CheY-like chemotaxis protein